MVRKSLNEFARAPKCVSHKNILSHKNSRFDSGNSITPDSLSLAHQHSNMSTIPSQSEVSFWLASRDLGHFQPPHDHKFVELTLAHLSQMAIDLQDTQYTTQLLSGRDRKWIHLLAECLGMSSESDETSADAPPQLHHTVGRKTYHNEKVMKILHVVKPAGWVFDASRTCQKVLPKGHAAKQTRLAAWSTTCNNCKLRLTAWTAFCNWRGIAFLCNACIEDDYELAGLKWEAYADC